MRRLPLLPLRPLLLSLVVAGVLPQARAAAQVPVGGKEDPVKARLAVLARDARDPNDARRLSAWEELLTHGDPGLEILRRTVAARLEKDRKALEEKFKGADLARARKKLEQALVERRQEALACIYDGVRYPDEDHGRVGQPEVDRLVARVREIWDHPATFARQLVPETEALAAWLEEDVVYLATAGGKPPEEMPTVAEWLDRFNAAFAVESLGISDGQHDRNVAIARYHAEEILTSADDQELACMQATNDYRRMMGRAILEIDERLVRAARKHSEEMKELGYFSHGSPVPANASFGGRCAREGYHGASAENIAGSGDGVGAFHGWYNSSGHHRNLLGGHQQIGVGRGGKHPGELFTQNFGGSGGLRGRTIDDPQILYLGKLRKLDITSAESEAAVAEWCRHQQLDEKARFHAARALALDPENEKAHLVLGHRRENGRWVEPPATDRASRQ